jgi:hypothetical protein
MTKDNNPAKFRECIERLNDAKMQIAEVKNTLTEMKHESTAGYTSAIMDSITELTASLEQWLEMVS